MAASTPVLPLAGPVSELAADGGRVAILVRTKTGNCARDRVAVWAPATRSFVPIGASACVGSTSTGAGLFSVGLAGTRVAYVQFAGGNMRELQLRLATLASPRAATVASASFGVDVGQGTYIGRVAGDGSLLAFDWWSECGPCAQATPVAPRASIFRPESSGCRPAALRLADYQAGIAVYVVGHGIHLLRLSDKRDVTIAAPGLGPVHVQLEQSGLFYSYRPAPSPTRGRVAFMPMAAVLARFR